MSKLLALDMDGTLLTDRRDIPSSVINAIRVLKNRCHVMLVTGRHHTAALPYYSQLQLDTPTICCNGTYVYDYAQAKVLSHSDIDKELALEFLSIAEHYQLELVVYVDEMMAYHKSSKSGHMRSLQLWADNIKRSIRPQIKPCSSFKAVIHNANHVWKFVVEGNSPQMEKFMGHPLINQHFIGERSWINRIDFARKGNTKGAALATHIEKLGLTWNDVIAVGDSYNDLSMLVTAGVGVAMKNSDPAIQEASNRVTKSTNNEGGVLEIITELLQQTDSYRRIAL
ncbi:Cof-type HAD-IIB family hydrolase [Vibrio nigripulchritudo]|uniref:Cof-type HAD-IIB family hydrolase n=1 Tax=Vibrio nigripulchritudo TaxID=28173 RepID=UPI00249253FB|nr:Cof-type HAD-IIB family hydrolase [Vibrio nigripulchritudo]BDU37013.1 haloacid dehalogenase [Vibrio nigripulchritudo]BDU42723.1 haloacid dehalogenase [Vibrio nigripulchritudo]